jgi:alkylhydroperoxidase family enzyme
MRKNHRRYAAHPFAAWARGLLTFRSWTRAPHPGRSNWAAACRFCGPDPSTTRSTPSTPGCRPPGSDVREVVILTVGGLWHSEYALYAHTAAAARAGVPDAAIGALRRGETPRGLRAEADAAHQLARAIIHDHEVPDGLYGQAIAILGTQTMITVLHLAGQYLTTSAVLACFQVPAPPAR